MKILTILTVVAVSFGLGVFHGERKVVRIKKAVRTEIERTKQTDETVKSLEKQLLDSKREVESILEISNNNSEKCELDILRLNNEVERLESSLRTHEEREMEGGYRSNLYPEEKAEKQTMDTSDKKLDNNNDYRNEEVYENEQ